MGRVEVENQLVGAVERPGPGQKGVHLDARLVGQVDQRGRPVADHLDERAALLLDPGPGDPVGEVARHVLLHDALAGYPVRVPLHAERAIAQVRQHTGGYVPVVADHVPLGDLGGGEERLAGVGQLDRDARDPYRLGPLGGHVSSPLDGTSRTTSAGSLSSRRPWNLGWRSSPASVHSENPTSPTSLGSTQCTPRGRGSGPAPNGGVARSSLTMGAWRLFSSRWLKAVPTLPAETSGPSEWSEPGRAAPPPDGPPRGSRTPPMTNSWPLSHLNFSQSLVRPARY